MKWILFLALIPSFAWARPLVLISYFDPFANRPFNNSERVAKEVFARHGAMNPNYDIRLCELETKFDVAYEMLTDCIRAGEKPDLVISLGEGNCNMKVETMGRNLDYNHIPDNAGVERNKTPVVPGAPKAVGLRYPLKDMYCSLSAKDRSDIEVSNSAGSFVCNNTTFNQIWKDQETPFGFIHVPANHCSNLPRRTEQTVQNLMLMIPAALGSLQQNSQIASLPINEDDIKKQRAFWKGKDECAYRFYSEVKPFWESFWSSLLPMKGTN